MNDAQSMTIQKLIVSVRRADDPSAEVPWPYGHVPRVGELFFFAPDVVQVVREVRYNYVEGGAFHAVIFLGFG